MGPESANEQNSSNGSVPSPGRYFPVQTANMQALLQQLLETPGLHASHVARAIEEKREPFTSLLYRFDASEAQAVQQHQAVSAGGRQRAANIAPIHARWQRDAEKIWNEGTHSLAKIAKMLANKYRKEYQASSPDDKEETKRYARRHHTIRKYIQAPQ